MQPFTRLNPARRRIVTTLLAGTGALLVGHTVGVQASSTSTVRACVTSTGAMRIILSSETCASGERLVTWNVEGPAGPIGPAGPPGPAARQWFLDRDADGFGDWYLDTWAAEQPKGYAANNDDCNDFDAEANPTPKPDTRIPTPAPIERPGKDGTLVTVGWLHLGDMDCDNARLEDLKLPPFKDDKGRRDSDGDGVIGVNDGGTDCNDLNASVFPSATEVRDINDIDEDCDPGTGTRPIKSSVGADPRYLDFTATAAQPRNWG